MFVLSNLEPTPIGRGLLFDVLFVMDINVREKHEDRGPESSIVGYRYTVLRSSDIEVVAYHWHPDSPEGSANPHIHFGPASARTDSAVRPGGLHKVHFPTGFVALEEVVWLVIDEFGIEPRRRDWQAILSQ